MIKKMKGLCYIALILGFFLFYQQNPVYAIIVIVIFVGVFLFFKSRSSSKGGVFRFFSGAQAQKDDKINDLITLMMIQQLLNPNDDRNNRPEYRPEFKKREKKDHIDKLKQEVFEILDEE